MISAGTKTLKIENKKGIRIGSLLQIGANECKIVEDYYENTIIVDSIFSRSYEKNKLIQIYENNVPSLPKDSQLLMTTFTVSVIMTGDISMFINNFGVFIPNQTYILLGTGTFLETCLIKKINRTETNVEIILNSPIKYTHNYGVVCQLFKYKDIPVGAILEMRTPIEQNIEPENSIIYFDTTPIKSTFEGNLFLQIGSGEYLERDFSIFNVSTNFVELSGSLKYQHDKDSLISIYSYSKLPENTALITFLHLRRPIKRGSREIFVEKINGFRPGMNYCIQVGNGENIDTELSVVSVNITNNTLTVSTPFIHNHLNESTLQVYIKNLPEFLLPSTRTNTVILEENIQSGSICISISCINGISVGMYGLIDVGDLVEYFTVLDVTKKNIYLSLQMKYSHKSGSVIQFFNAVHPDGTLLVNYKQNYEFVKRKETIEQCMGSSLISEELEIELLNKISNYKTNWEEIFPSSVDAILFLTPMLLIAESRCLTFSLNEPTSNICAYIPYYTKIKYYYKELSKISNYNPIPKVIALWDLMKEIVFIILPNVEKSKGTDINILTEKMQMLYSIYCQLYASQLRFESYLKSLNVNIISSSPHLNNTDFLVLPKLELTFGCLIGGSHLGIGIINEPGTIYTKPYVNNKTIIVNDTSLLKEKTRQGDKNIELNSFIAVNLNSVVVIDIGIAQETRAISQINGSVIVLDKELTYPHNENSMIFICSKTNPINFVLNEFTTEFRLIENIEILSEKYDIPTSTFIAYGNIDIELFSNTFLFGTTNLNEFISDFRDSSCTTYKNVQKKTMGFYIDSSLWNDVDNNNPKLDFSKLKCKSGYYNTGTYVENPEPELSVIQTSTLIHNIFDIVDGLYLVSNMNEVSNSMKYNFSKYIWNNVYGTILWTQDYKRKPLETIIVDTQTRKNVNFSNEYLLEDPLNPGMHFIPSSENSGSITQKLFSQLTGGDITRLRSAKKYKDTSNIYHFPFVEGDTIVFKVNVKYAINNVSSIFNKSGIQLPENMVDLNERFNQGEIEHLDYNSYTIVLTLI